MLARNTEKEKTFPSFAPPLTRLRPRPPSWLPLNETHQSCPPSPWTPSPRRAPRSAAPSCLLDEADGEALPGETGGSDFGIVRLVRDEGWGLSTGALAAVLAVAGCGRAGAFGVFHTHDDTVASAAVLTRTAVAHTQSVEQRRLRDADAGALLPKAGNVVRERWFAGSLNAIG